MQWIPLQLDMLPAIAIETAKVIELYRNVHNEIEMGQTNLIHKLKQLNLQFKKRINQFDQFYNRYYSDDRIHLFHRLKLQMKKVISKSMQEIEKSYIHAQSLDISKVRQELALIESTLQKQYQKDKQEIKPVITVHNNSSHKKSTQSKNKTNTKNPIPQKSSHSKIVPSKLNLDKLKQSDSKMTTSRKNKPITPPLASISKPKTTQRQSIPSIQSTTRPIIQQIQPKKPSKVPMQQLVFTIKMTKQEYLQFLESKKGGN